MNQNATVDLTPGTDTPIQFNANTLTYVEYKGDRLTRIFFKVRIGGPAPEGYRFKKHWWAYLFKKYDLNIDKNRAHFTTNPILTKLYGSATEDKEDGSFIVEPLRISEITSAKHFRMICYGFARFYLNIEWGSFEDCIEPIDPSVKPPYDKIPDLDVKVFGEYENYTVQEERFKACAEKARDDIVLNSLTTTVLANMNEVNIDSKPEYVYITDLDGHEIPESLASVSVTKITEYLSNTLYEANTTYKLKVHWVNATASCPVKIHTVHKLYRTLITEWGCGWIE